MPELPEVETIRRTLSDKKIIGKKIKSTYIPHSRLVHSDLIHLHRFINGFKSESITSLQRWGKYLFIIGEKHSLTLHLGMSGVLYWKQKNYSPTSKMKHRYLQIDFTDGCKLIMTDPRTFGKIIPCAHPLIPSRKNFSSNVLPAILKKYFQEKIFLGPDALVTPTPKLVKICKQKSLKSVRAIKNVLLDQSILAGIGNIYADESLFKTQISPLRPTHKLTLKEWHNLVSNIKKVFRKAIKWGGSTLNDYRHPDGLEGNFQSHFMVYGKANCPCPRCGNLLHKKSLQSRTTVFCSHCQK